MNEHVQLELRAGAVESRRLCLVSRGPEKHTIAELAEKRLRASAYLGLRTLQCEDHEGILVLRGRVSTYHQKQMAQEAVRNLHGVEMILNHVEVVAPMVRG